MEFALDEIPHVPKFNQMDLENYAEPFKGEKKNHFQLGSKASLLLFLGKI